MQDHYINFIIPTWYFVCLSFIQKHQQIIIITSCCLQLRFSRIIKFLEIIPVKSWKWSHAPLNYLASHSGFPTMLSIAESVTSAFIMLHWLNTYFRPECIKTNTHSHFSSSTFQPIYILLLGVPNSSSFQPPLEREDLGRSSHEVTHSSQCCSSPSLSLPHL